MHSLGGFNWHKFLISILFSGFFSEESAIVQAPLNTVYIPVICAVVLISCVVTVVICLCRRKQSSNKKEPTPSNGKQLNHEHMETIISPKEMGPKGECAVQMNNVRPGRDATRGADNYMFLMSKNKNMDEYKTCARKGHPSSNDQLPDHYENVETIFSPEEGKEGFAMQRPEKNAAPGVDNKGYNVYENSQVKMP